MMKGMLSPGSVPLDRGSTAADGPTDSQLLARFAQSRDGAAFEQLVRRYGSMVLGVCRRVLGDANDAEDAFQATFLVLVRRAPSITQPDLLGNWLYGVAYRVARKARAQRAKRAQQKAPTPAMSSPDPLVDAVLRELQEQLDEELERLPTKYRAPLVLCYLEGLSNREAAQRLGWPVGSISHRLARGREMLRQRLQDRHPNASYLVLGALPLFAAASAEVLPHLHSLAMKLARTAADDEAEAALTESVRSLAEQTLKEMSPARRPGVTLAVVGILLALSAVALAGWKAFASGPGPVQPSQSSPATPCCHGSPPAEDP
jgi:RNA polymerase sigma factor (sigma-70 family)